MHIYEQSWIKTEGLWAMNIGKFKQTTWYVYKLHFVYYKTKLLVSVVLKI